MKLRQLYYFVEVQLVKVIPKDELIFEYMRARGPGGQNVNRTNSAVQLRWKPLESKIFSEREMERVVRFANGKLTIEGELLIRSEGSRDQDANRKSCLEKLNDWIAKALFVPKKRLATKPTRSSREKRLTNKKRHGEKKSGRSQKNFD